MKSGSRLGPYEILHQLGAGGMGEVWLAEDSRLGRRVAIKVLPARVSDDPQGLARLEQEARILAQLEHPNVAAVYGLERTPAEDGAPEVLYLVMQYAEGETLADRIGGGEIPVDEALEIARQVAAGLGAAHDKGIVHRDLKPANVMLAEGAAGAAEVTVLDFGLAKAHGASGTSGSADMSASPTMAALTAAGFILGTAAYMSPEQARGKATDRRTDVWAFGCLVFEMLAGRQAFGGETVSDVMAAILKEEPDWSVLPPGVPATVRRGLHRCLSKDPEQRPYDVRDVVLGFRDDEAMAATEETTDSAAATKSDLRWPMALAALAGGLAIGYVVAGVGSDTSGATGQPALYRQMTAHAGVEAYPRLSGDGEWIVYASQADGDWDIYLQKVGAMAPINLTAAEPADDLMPAFSPDGNEIVFRSERGEGGVYVMGTTGDSVRRISNQGYNPVWSPEGDRVVAATEPIWQTPYDRAATSALVIIDVELGDVTPLQTGDAVQPAWSPDGQRIVYWGLAVGGKRDLWTVGVAGGEPVQLTDDEATDWTPTWTHDGQAVLYSSDRAGTLGLWRAALDPMTGAPAGVPQPVVVSGGGEWIAFPSVSDDGESLLYAATRSSVDVYQLDLGPDFRPLAAGPRRLTEGSRNAFGPDLSPDGSLLLYQTGHGQQEDLILQPLDGTPLRRLTNDVAKDRGPRFSPDGTEVIFYSDRDGPYELFVIPIDGSAARRITAAGLGAGMAAWAPDGRRVASNFGLEQWLGVVALDGTAPDPTEVNMQLPEGASFQVHSWSASGDQLAGHLMELSTGRSLGIVAVDAATGEYKQLTDFGEYSAWLNDSRHIAFSNFDAIWVVDSNGGEPWRVVTPSPDVVIDFVSGWRSGRSILYGVLSSEADLWLTSW